MGCWPVKGKGSFGQSLALLRSCNEWVAHRAPTVIFIIFVFNHLLPPLFHHHRWLAGEVKKDPSSFCSVPRSLLTFAAIAGLSDVADEVGPVAMSAILNRHGSRAQAWLSSPFLLFTRTMFDTHFPPGDFPRGDDSSSDGHQPGHDKLHRKGKCAPFDGGWVKNPGRF